MNARAGGDLDPEAPKLYICLKRSAAMDGSPQCCMTDILLQRGTARASGTKRQAMPATSPMSLLSPFAGTGGGASEQYKKLSATSMAGISASLPPAGAAGGQQTESNNWVLHFCCEQIASTVDDDASWMNSQPPCAGEFYVREETSAMPTTYRLRLHCVRIRNFTLHRCCCARDGARNRA